MRFCPHCKLEIFGGNICHVCGYRLVRKDEAAYDSPENTMTPALLFSPRKKIKGDLTQSFGMRILRLLFEVVLFCGVFIGGTYFIMHASDWLSDQMQSELWRFNVVEDGSVRNPIRYFWYTGCVIITILTIKFRYKLGD